MAVNDLWAIKIYTTFMEQTAINVRHYTVLSFVGDPINPIDVAASFETIWHGAYKDCMSDDAQWAGVGAQRIFPLPAALEGYSQAEAGPGAQTGEPLPPQICGIITLRTANAGPGFRGRLYMAFPAETDNNVDGVPVAAYMTRLDVFAQTLNDNVIITSGLDTMTLAPVLYKRGTGSTSLIQTCLGRKRWATQRRRGHYGRPNAPPFG